MTQERQEGRYISPENATHELLSRCGIENLIIIQGEDREDMELTDLKRKIKRVRYDMGEIGLESSKIKIYGIDNRNLQFMPTFRSDGNLYMIHGLTILENDLTMNASIQHKTLLETVAMNPVELLSLMPQN